MKKTLSLLLVLAMVLSSFTAFAGADTVAAEVKTHLPFMQGVGGNKFAADKDITRQEVAVTISRALKLEGGKLDFNDANEIADWAKDGVAALQKAGIVKGNQKGNFNPKDKIDRASLAAMLVRAYENINEEIEVKDISFKDVKGNEWYAEEVKKAASIGIVKGNGKGNFNPTDKATRAEIAIMVNRLLGLDKVEGVDKLETKFDDADKWPNWAKEAILVATTEFDYKVEDGEVVVVTEDVEEVKVEELEAVIAKAEKAAEDAVVGEKDGNYPQEAVDALKAAIKDAKAVLENKEATQEEVDKAAEELTAAIKTFEEKVVVVEELKVVEVSAINANTISVTFEGIEEPVEIELEEALVHGENEVTFEYEGQTFTVTVNYEDPEVVEEEKAEAIKNAIDKINAIGKPATLTLEDEAKVVAARTAVNAAKELGAVDADIVNLDHLNAAETQINALKEALNEKETAIQEANVALTNLPLEVTLEDKEQVEEARELVNKALDLGAEENDFVNLWKLEGAEATIAELEAEAADAEAAKAVEEAITALPAVEELTVEDAETVADARAAYDALTEEQQELVTNVDVLEAAEAKIAELEEEAAKELKVESVSAINANYVVVKIKPLEEDLLKDEYEVEVKNSKDEIVPVKQHDIAAGDKTAEFEFVTAVKADDLKGVWTVNGKEYDLDLFNNLKAFLDAGNQLALNKALTDLGIKNVDVANMPAYFEAKGELDKTALELTVADVQKLVDDVNAKFVSAEEEAAIVKAVVDSLAGDTVNQVALLQALQNKAFVRVNADWVADATNGYAVKLKGANLTKDSKIKDIQTVINTSNDALIKAELDKLKTDNDYTELDKAKLTKVKNLIATYATVDDKGVIDNADIKAAVEGKVIEIQLALADVVAATTPTSLKNRVVALNELLAKDAKIDMEKEYIDDNGKGYITQIAEDKVNTVTKLKTAISTVNTNASNKLLENVQKATDADALLKALKAYPGLKQVADTNKDVYYKETTAEEVTTKNVNFKDVTSADDIQTAVNEANIAAIKAANEDSIIEKLNVLELKNVEPAYAKAYAESAKASEVDGSISKATDAEAMQKAVNAVNQTVVENAQLKAINEAKTVAEVKAALDALANVDKAADYLTIRSVDRDFVAAHVLENRPEENGYADVDAIETEIGKEGSGETTEATGAIKAYHEALDGINNITRTSTPVEVANALGKVLDEDFTKLSNTEKTAKAEEFQAKLTFDEKGSLKTTFVTLADVKALLK